MHKGSTGQVYPIVGVSEVERHLVRDRMTVDMDLCSVLASGKLRDGSKSREAKRRVPDKLPITRLAGKLMNNPGTLSLSSAFLFFCVFGELACGPTLREETPPRTPLRCEPRIRAAGNYGRIVTHCALIALCVA